MTAREEILAALPEYEIGGELGRGGFGLVLSGRHRQLRREVAIKELPPALAADPRVRARFAAEARVLASLSHPHIVPIYDYVERDGVCLLVMEKLTGGTLWDQFKEIGLGVETTCAVAMAACTALHYAHQRGVLHRDVKPENLLYSSEGVLKITDFGIAKVVGGAETLATRGGEILGTPAYMAPEQAEGRELGPAADVYATGIMLYELLSGHLPFSEEGGALAIVYRHVYENPIPLEQVAPNLEPGLVEVTMRSISRSPGDRFASAEAFGVAIGEAVTPTWGPTWLGRAGMQIVDSGPIAESAKRPTNATTAYARTSGSPAEAPLIPPTRPAPPSGGDLPPFGTPPLDQPPGAPATGLPPTGLPPAGLPPTAVPPAGLPPTAVPPSVPPLPGGAPPTIGPTPTGAPPTIGPSTTGGPPAGAAPTIGPAPAGAPATTGPSTTGGPPAGAAPTIGPAPTGAPATTGPSTTGGAPGGAPPTIGPGPSGAPATIGPASPGVASGPGMLQPRAGVTNIVRPQADDHVVGGAGDGYVVVAELVPVRTVIELPSPPYALGAAAVVLFLVAITVALIGFGKASVTNTLPPGVAARVNGVDPAKGTTVDLDLSKPVAVQLSGLPATVTSVQMAFSVAGIPLPASSTETLAPSGDGVQAMVSASTDRYLLGGVATADLRLIGGGTTLFDQRFLAKSKQPAFVNVPGGLVIALLLFFVAYMESLLRPLRRGRRGISGVIGMAVLGAGLGATVVGIMWQLGSPEPTVTTVVVCAACGAGTGVTASLAAIRIARRARIRPKKGRRPLR